MRSLTTVQSWRELVRLLSLHHIDIVGRSKDDWDLLVSSTTVDLEDSRATTVISGVHLSVVVSGWCKGYDEGASSCIF